MEKQKRITLNADKRKVIADVFQNHFEDNSKFKKAWQQAKETYNDMRSIAKTKIDVLVRTHQPQEDVDTIRSMINKYGERNGGELHHDNCFYVQTDTPTIANLVASNDSASLTLYWYESENATTPLDSSVELTHNTTYYSEFIDQEGCISTGRTPSKAFLSNPILSASNEVICVNDTTTLSIQNVAKTAADFAVENNCYVD